MSADELEIRSGGVVAVDTVALRDAATRLRLIAADTERARELLARAAAVVPAAGWIALGSLGRAVDGAARAAADAERMAADLTALADVYEYVELRAGAAAARAAGDHAAADLLQREALLLAERTPQVRAAFVAARDDWRDRRDDGLATITDRVLPVAAVVPLTALGVALLPSAATALVGVVDRGTVAAGRPLAGPRPAVTVTPLAPAAPATAPRALADVVARVGMAPEARVRVETYRMPGGTAQYVAYVTGTKNDAPGEAFDGDANLDAYLRERESASIAAVRQVLEDAGAEPGDRVHLVGHSQGAMAATHVAMDSRYDVATLVTIGSPVQGDVGEGTLSVALRHTDDPVSALAGGGFAHGTGAPGSFVAERLGLAPDAPPGDWLLGAHGLGPYADTAALLDASADPRMTEVRERLAELRTASSVSVVEYAVSAPDARVSASSAGGG